MCSLMLVEDNSETQMPLDTYKPVSPARNLPNVTRIRKSGSALGRCRRGGSFDRPSLTPSDSPKAFQTSWKEVNSSWLKCSRAIFPECWMTFLVAWINCLRNIASPDSLAADGCDGVFSPPVEMGRTDDQMNLRVVLPGVTRNDLKVSVQGQQLIIEANARRPKASARRASLIPRCHTASSGVS